MTPTPILLAVPILVIALLLGSGGLLTQERKKSARDG